MPVNVIGEDGRTIEKGSRLEDAYATASRILDATGEVVTLVDIITGEKTTVGSKPTKAGAKADPPSPSEKPVGSMTKPELEALAAELGIEIAPKAKKPAVLKAVKAAIAKRDA